MCDMTIKLLTYNTWGLKYVSKHRQDRLQAIGDILATQEYDVVALQEVWCEDDWRYISTVCAQYPYRRMFRLGIVSGPGLAILSKLPITETFLYRFPINGRALAFFRGDWYVGKSVAVTLLDTGTTPVAVLNSHMHAPYTSDNYSTHRAVQAWDMAKIIRVLKGAGYAVVQVGDLNSRPGSLPYKLFTVEAGLSDSWEVLHKSPPADLAALDPEQQILLGGVTCDSQLNTWRAARRRDEACRLDYALIDASRIVPVAAAVTFTDRHPVLGCLYLDHFAYSVELALRESVTETHSQDLQKKVYEDLVHEIDRYRQTTLPWQAGWRKAHFLGSLVSVVVIWVVIPFALARAPWSSVLLCIGAVVIGVSGVVNGLIWGLGVRLERRALEEVQMEVYDRMGK